MISDAWNFLLDIILWLPKKVFQWLVDVVELLMGWLPDIELADPSQLISGLGNDLLYFLTVFQFGYGVTAIFTALLARFILRRIPFIGG